MSPAVNLGMPRRLDADFGRGQGNLIEHIPFPLYAGQELGNEQMRRNLTHATRTIRSKRALVVNELPDWQDLRTSGSAIKTHVLANLPELLEEFERHFTARGGHLHWAADADEANAIVTRLIQERGETEVVKIKSMATQEIGLNEHLEALGITAIETDLAEEIVQLGGDRPSHILVPAIHRNRDEIRDIFVREMDNTDESLTNDPADLAEASRVRLREHFLRARIAISGANFGVASTGTLSVVESEGNGRMCLTLPDTLITVMGIEKLIPSVEDLGVFLQLLPRSSTGERMNPYTSLWTGITPGDGPQDVHLVLLDNGRTRALADEHGRSALHCIRCSACLNVCPVYERAGGHAYGSTYPGPIGAILSPLLTGIAEGDNNSLPYASSLCGACYEVCPVKINIPDILVHLRSVDHEARHGRGPDGAVPPTSSSAKQLDAGLDAAKLVMSDGRRFGFALRFVPLMRVLGRGGVIRKLPFIAGKWTSVRDIEAPTEPSFRQWWRRNRRKGAGQ